MRNLDADYRALCGYADLQRDARLGSAACLLVTARNGAAIQDDSIADMVESLAAMAQQYDMEPEDVQAALVASEPTLGDNWPFEGSNG